MAAIPTLIPTPRIGTTYQSSPAFLRTTMDAGNVRKRRRFVNPRVIFNVEWMLTQTQMTAFEDFFHTTLEAGGDWFDIPLPTPYRFGVEEARFVNNPQVTAIAQGEETIWTVTAQLEVRNLIRDTTLIDFINAGLNPNDFILAVDRLEHFVNNTQPTQLNWDTNP